MNAQDNNEKGDSNADPAHADHGLKGLAKPRPLTPPPPTVWPFVTAVGLTAFFWGMVLNLTVLLVGAAVFAVGMAGLTGDWVGEHKGQSVSSGSGS